MQNFMKCFCDSCWNLNSELIVVGVLKFSKNKKSELKRVWLKQRKIISQRKRIEQ